MNPADGCILIVDDHAALLKNIAAYVRKLGYRVETCQSAADASALIESGSSSFTAILVDMTMPGISGAELARRALEADNSVCVVMMSGFPTDITELEALNPGRVRFLQKPFAPEELAAALK